MRRSPSVDFSVIGTLAAGLFLFLATQCADVGGSPLRTVCRNESVVETVEIYSSSCYVAWLWSDCGRSLENKTVVKEVCYNVTDIRQLPPLPTTAAMTPPIRQPDLPVRQQPDQPVRQQPDLPARRPDSQQATPPGPSAQHGSGQGAGYPDLGAAYPGFDINSLPIIEISKAGKDGCYNETRFLATYEEDPDCYLARLWNGCWRPVNRTFVIKRCKGTLPHKASDTETTDGDGKLTDAEILSVATITTLVVAIAITVASITAKQRLRRRKHSSTEEDLKVYDRTAVDSNAGTPSSPMYKSSTYKPAAGSSDPSVPLLHKPPVVAAACGLAIPLLPTHEAGGCSEQPNVAVATTTSCADAQDPPSSDWDNCRETRA